ncbi:carboxylesterase family protein [Staphylococcus aureus]|uniref:carboxylesterase family protein n=1 Tax=Staphylococcus aureus TaxID=1280 RepID=UPI0021F13710|nr:carboxylesterase family protein [Staphylococcus aureus]
MQNHQVHDNRFKHSTLKTQWSEPIDATEIQPIPPQPDNKLEDFFSSQSATFTEHERLFIFKCLETHNDQTKKPVIIYFYGGSF